VPRRLAPRPRFPRRPTGRDQLTTASSFRPPPHR
jgi:hypothetical protein